MTIRDPSSEQRTAALSYVAANIDEYAKAVGSTPAKAEAFPDLESAVKNSWLVIEAVPEKLQLKIDTFGDLDRLSPSDCLLCSNSSSYKSSEMLDKVSPLGRKRVLNTHYMMPPDNRIVELMTDGETAPEIFPFLVDAHKKVGMHPIVARRESTGFVFNRVWAAIKRESLMILAEGVSVPEELDRVWMEMFGSKAGPCAMMDGVGLDTVEFIERHYMAERGYPGTHTVDFLRANYIEAGKLGAKSSKGGLYPPGYTTKPSTTSKSDHSNLHGPLLYFLDIGLAHTPDKVLNSGSILLGSSDGKPLKTLVSGESFPDGLDISPSTGRIYWTCMGIPSANDGSLKSCKLDGSDVQTIIQKGNVHTPKQLTIDHANGKLYFCDREGLRVFRCDFNGANLECLIRTGDWKNPEHQVDQTRWCVGITVDSQAGKFYWTQKGPSKGTQGRIFRANINTPASSSPDSRPDVELLFSSLPEPVDLEICPETQMLYWTDRGELPFGNSINRASIAGASAAANSVAGRRKPGEQGTGYDILARHLHEAIGLRLDLKNRHIYTTDLGGCVYRFDMQDGGNKKKLYDEDEGAFTGIGMMYV